MKRLIAAVLLVFVSACTTAGSTGPVLDNAAAQRAVFDAEGKYKLALIAAVAYVDLPLCTASKPPCATLAVVRVIQRAQPAARTALDAAELTTRTPGFGNDIYSSAVTAATSAVSAFATITSTLK